MYYLDTSKACGPDGIPTRLLKECSFQIAPSVCELFNHSLHTGQIPSEWKSANVTPVHKKDRRVVIDGVVSSWAPVTSGVLQGSILGPVLFALFINDLPNVLPDETMAALYANDTKVYKSIRSKADCEILRHALARLGSWSTDNNLDFNQSKCKVLTITRKKTPLVYAYHMGSKYLLRVDIEKDLGVDVCANFKWDVHTHTIIGKANRMLGLLKRTCPLLTSNSARRTLYLTHVRSQLCYASEV